MWCQKWVVEHILADPESAFTKRIYYMQKWIDYDKCLECPYLKGRYWDKCSLAEDGTDVELKKVIPPEVEIR